MQANVEVNNRKNLATSAVEKEKMSTIAQQKHLKNERLRHVNMMNKELTDAVENKIKELEDDNKQ